MIMEIPFILLFVEDYEGATAATTCGSWGDILCQKKLDGLSR